MLFLFIISQRSNGCYVLCLNRNIFTRPKFHLQILMLISVLFALNFNIQSSGYDMTSRFHCGIYRYFCGIMLFIHIDFAIKNLLLATMFCPLTAILNTFTFILDKFIILEYL